MILGLLWHEDLFTRLNATFALTSETHVQATSSSDKSMFLGSCLDSAYKTHNHRMHIVS